MRVQLLAVGTWNFLLDLNLPPDAPPIPTYHRFPSPHRRLPGTGMVLLPSIAPSSSIRVLAVPLYTLPPSLPCLSLAATIAESAANHPFVQGNSGAHPRPSTVQLWIPHHSDGCRHHCTSSPPSGPSPLTACRLELPLWLMDTGNIEPPTPPLPKPQP
uniref:Uncharacterized protein n=1 Tax=Setaria viridis TaxID=4556 RepID=A0A4U6TRQ9_SETVI|nr:hypothetical protein SEVIR_8G095900v2 [Setaria viridis]